MTMAERIWLSSGLAAAGAVLGSFLSTAAIRSVAGRGWIAGRSACDGCGRPLSFARTLPLIGYLAGRGRCTACGGPINPLHPLAELAGAVGLAAAGWLLGGPALALTLAVLILLLAIGLVDAASQRIPDGLTLLLALAALGLAAMGGTTALLVGLATALAAGGLLLVLRLAYHRLRGHQGLGLGDVKLVAALAPAIGPSGLAPMIAAASLGALAWSLIGRTGLDRRLAFGPFLCLAAAAWLIWRSQLPDWLGGA
jgi:leader peptidase (prepilin peptidase)/N-methyltransferase